MEKSGKIFSSGVEIILNVLFAVLHLSLWLLNSITADKIPIHHAAQCHKNFHFKTNKTNFMV
jgi:hypothetical protein